MASVGQLLRDFWQQSGVGTKEVTLPGGTHPIVYIVMIRPEDWSHWETSPPFVFPGGWENVINPEDPHAAVVLGEFPSGDSAVAIPYIWAGGGSPGGSVVLDVEWSNGTTYALQLSLEPGEVLAGFTGERHESAEAEDPLSVPGVAPADGLLVVCSGRTTFFPG